MMKLSDGFYKVTDHFLDFWKVEGDKIEFLDILDIYPSSLCKVDYGDFG